MRELDADVVLGALRRLVVRDDGRAVGEVRVVSGVVSG
jgi:hypothetical protein